MARTTELAPGPLAISDELRGLLGALAAMDVRAQRTSIALSEITAVEERLELALPYDVIALVALAMPELADATGLGLEVETLTTSHDLGNIIIAEHWVPIATADAHAMHPAYDPATDQTVATITLCVSRRGGRGGDPKVLLVDERTETTSTRPLSAFLRDRLAERYSADREDAWQRALAAPLAIEPPVLEDDRPAPVRVTHPKFGTGTITQELADGKVEVAFDVAGTKVLLRKFVRET